MADENSPWLQRVKEAFSSSTTFVDANYRKQWEDNLKAFQSRHHGSSKYSTEQYKFRSKVFRPKTRAAIRNNEAAAAAAFFTNKDIVSIDAENPSNPIQQASAEVMQELLQYRLTKSIPWFITLIGGFQDAQVMGAVASYQTWKYEERERDILIPTGVEGEFLKDTQVEIVKDHPDIELIPIENIRIDQAADWRDPIRSSPYVQRLIPMYVMDVRARMKEEDEKTGQPKWNRLDDDEIASGSKLEFDSTRLTRENEREDKFEEMSKPAIKDYDVVWVIENFMRDGKGQDMIFYTLGLEHMLSDPVPIDDVYFTGERPLALGVGIIETHRLFPTSVAELGQNIQREINEVTNQRLDNVKLVLNKRYFVKRGSQVDLKSILRNVPGSVTFVNDVASDVRDFDFTDVTSSSYEEQNRLATEYDELVGNFSQSSVANNRRLNETVGGMQMMRSASFGLTEYLIRTFSETWVNEVLTQLVKLEQKYETDFVLLALAAEKAQIFQKYGIDEVTDELLNQELTLDVNVGIGATDPVTKLNQFLAAMKALTEILAAPPPNLNMEEVQKEIFGRLGHKDGGRFFQTEEGMSQNEQQLMQAVQEQRQIIQQLQAALESDQADNQTKLQTTAMKEEGANVRKEAELETRIQEKLLDLQNPVPGEVIQ